MKDILLILQNKIFLFIIIGILGIINIITVVYFTNSKIDACICDECPTIETTISTSDKINVDIKGYVKNPGVYEIDNNSLVNDLIELAGGLTKDASTDNINLSKKLSDEDVVIISSKSKVKQDNNKLVSTATIPINKTSTIIKSTTTKNSDNKDNYKEEIKSDAKTISLNNATLEELMTLNGIGEKKAMSIIEYREKTPFKEIEEIKSISGIGESIFAKIKDYITI